MWRSFMVAPKSIIADEGGGTSNQQPDGQLPFPAIVIDRIFDELDILDRCCLALCNKALLKQASKNEHLNYIHYWPPSRNEIQDFFARRLGYGWVDRGVRYCHCCGNFATTVALRWRLISERQTRERSGRIADLWRSRRDDGWLRYWLERWCDEALDGSDPAVSAIRQADRTTIICPRCAITDSQSNAWRRKISVSKDED